MVPVCAMSDPNTESKFKTKFIYPVQNKCIQTSSIYRLSYILYFCLLNSISWMYTLTKPILKGLLIDITSVPAVNIILKTVFTNLVTLKMAIHYFID